MSTCDDEAIESGLRHLAADDNLARLEAELSGHTEYEVIDGYRIGPDGEVLEFMSEPRFAIDSESAAEWVLEKRQDEEARIVALKAKREAILANLDREIRHHEGRVKALDYRFGPELEAFARTRLSGKRRTWTCPYGSVAFRKQAAKWRWADGGKERAIEWARQHKATAIKSEVREWVEFDAIKSVIDGHDLTTGDLYNEDAVEWIRDLARVVEFVPEGEKVTISTGVK